MNPFSGVENVDPFQNEIISTRQALHSSGYVINDVSCSEEEDDNERNLSSTDMVNQHLVSKESLQRKLSFYFMSPINKWRTKRRLPFKLLFQLLKIIFVTMQLIYFGNKMSNYLSQEDNMSMSFKEILLDHWDATREVLSYPPANGPYAIYTTDHFYDSIDFAIRQYSNISKLSVGAFGYPSETNNTNNFPTIIFEKSTFSELNIDPSKYWFTSDSVIDKKVLIISHLYPSNDGRWNTKFNCFHYFNEKNFSINFDSLIELKIILPLRAVYFDSVEDNSSARCYDLNITIIYNNEKHDGAIPIKLLIEKQIQHCNSVHNVSDPNEFKPGLFMFNIIVIIFCTLSIISCIRSIYRGQMLRMEAEVYFLKFHNTKFLLSDRLEFLDPWILIICLNDVLIISGTVLKIRIEKLDLNSFNYTSCSLFLGIGNLLVWLGLLRYLSYFKSYNILILTLKRSIPNVIRFIFCAFLIYCGFCFCGWVVLGPHHIKFRTLSSTSECLFSLMNGDDMFATFFITNVPKNTIIWWFSRIYLYFFICLFIYVIVSLCISIILDAYEAISEFYKNKEPPKSMLKKFIDDNPIPIFDGSFHNNSIMDQIHHYFTYFFRQA